MSVAILLDEHINAIAYAACRLKDHEGQSIMLSYEHNGSTSELYSGQLERVALLLKQANYRSYIACYAHRDDIDRTVPAEHDAKIPQYHYSALELLKAVKCFEYQACEASDWQSSEAHAICQALKDKLIGMLPGFSSVAGWFLGDDPLPKRVKASKESRESEAMQACAELALEVANLREKLAQIAKLCQ